MTDTKWEEPEWTKKFDQFNRELSGEKPMHLPYCKALTGHTCDCWMERMLKIPKEVA